ncbi:hypothetical protein V1478_018212 [Vespula squamosa]|uniref:Uncharacterized protein n=1 Tax=Vespula squamosa TaxID=30214 RepID=A0ABD1ZUD0_VESSQ
MINPVLWFNAKFLNFNAKIPSSLLNEVIHSTAKHDNDDNEDDDDEDDDNGQICPFAPFFSISKEKKDLEFNRTKLEASKSHLIILVSLMSLKKTNESSNLTVTNNKKTKLCAVQFIADYAQGQTLIKNARRIRRLIYIHIFFLHLRYRFLYIIFRGNERENEWYTSKECQMTKKEGVTSNKAKNSNN